MSVKLPSSSHRHLVLLGEPDCGTRAAGVADDDRVLVHAELRLHEGEPDGAPRRHGVRHVAQRAAQPGHLVQSLCNVSISKALMSHLMMVTLLTHEYQFARVTSPDPLPGIITALFGICSEVVPSHFVWF